jgi:hypothetical protein
MSASCRLRVVKRKMLMVIQPHPALHSVVLGKLQVTSGITARHRIVTVEPNKSTV